jgi:hypothetical protein
LASTSSSASDDVIVSNDDVSEYSDADPSYSYVDDELASAFIETSARGGGCRGETKAR